MIGTITAIFITGSSYPKSYCTPTHCINSGLLDSSHINLIVAPFCLESPHGVFSYLMLHNKSPKILCLKKKMVSASVDQAFGKDSAWKFSLGDPVWLLSGVG